MGDCVFVKTEETVMNFKKEFENVDVKEEDPLMIPSNSETLLLKSRARFW